MPGAPPRDLSEREQPELFASLRAVAARAGVELPERVVLLCDVNASIEPGEPGALGLGLGLLSIHTVSELGAAIAHELGHGARPRGAAGYALRVLRGLAEHLARRRELRADEAAIRAVGRDVHLSALERAARGAALFEAFVQDEVAPILRAGRRPDNVYDGFRAYVAELSEAAGEGGLPAPPGRSHPSLDERLEHARGLPDDEGAPPRDDRPARSLLANAERLERELSASVAAALVPGARLAPVGWLDVADVVWAPRLAEEGRVLALQLATASGCAPTATGALAALVRGLEAGEDEALARAVEPALAAIPELHRPGGADGVLARALGALLGCALLERGWRWRSEVGRALEVARGPASLEPFVEARDALRDRARLPRLLQRAGTAA
jgi:hypothetical protein